MSALFTATEQHGQNVTPFLFVYASLTLARRAVEQSAEASGQTITGWNCYRAGFKNIAIFDGGSYIITQCDLDAGGPANLTPEQASALKMFAAEHGRCWKNRLSHHWQNASAPATLHSLRNTHGPEWLRVFRLASLESAP